MIPNPYQRYKEQSLSTLAPGEILVKLYDESLKQLTLAKLKIDQKDYGASDNAFLKVQSILSTLADSLDMRYPISKELRNMYAFLSQHLLRASIKKDVQMVDDCVPLIRDLRDAFDSADKVNRRSSVGTSGIRRATL